jgi:hypothetical protein
MAGDYLASASLGKGTLAKDFGSLGQTLQPNASKRNNAKIKARAPTAGCAAMNPIDYSGAGKKNNILLNTPGRPRPHKGNAFGDASLNPRESCGCERVF